MGSICVLRSCLLPLLQSIKEVIHVPVQSMYVWHVCKQTDLNVESIQNLPSLKIHTLTYCKQVAATCIYKYLTAEGLRLWPEGLGVSLFRWRLLLAGIVVLTALTGKVTQAKQCGSFLCSRLLHFSSPELERWESELGFTWRCKLR